MAQASWTLTDVASGIDHPDFLIGPGDVAGTPPGWSIRKRTLHGGLQSAVTAVEVNNGRLRFEILLTRGMGIWKAWMDDATLGWQSPVRGPVHPKFVPLMEPSGLGWLDGFDELLVRCGLESNGAPDFGDRGVLKYPLHGRIANRPAFHVEVHVDAQAGEIAVTGQVEESRFLFQQLRLTSTVTTKFNEQGLRVHDEVQNLSASPAGMQMLYHVNFGVPLLESGAKLLVPAKAVVPRDERAAQGVNTWQTYGAPEPGFAEQVYFFDLHADKNGQTLALLRNASATEGASLRFNTRQLPCFTQWKNTAAVADGYVTGLEPATNFPNRRSHEEQNGRVVSLAPHATQCFDLQLDWFRDAESVAAVEAVAAKLQGERAPTVHSRPLPGWCVV